MGKGKIRNDSNRANRNIRTVGLLGGGGREIASWDSCRDKLGNLLEGGLRMKLSELRGRIPLQAKTTLCCGCSTTDIPSQTPYGEGK